MRWVLAATVVLFGCTGSIMGNGPGPGGAGGGTGLDPSSPSACTGAPIDPGPLLMRRLTNAEYRASVELLLGVDAAAEVALFPADLRRTGFDNAFDLQTVSVPHADRYHAASKALVARVFADPSRRAALLGCDPSGGNRTTCLRTFVARLGRLAFRRTLEPEEIDTSFTVTTGETDPLEGAQLAARALLESPSFLWRAEVGPALTGPELATRLSFFLWGAPPDEALLDAAERGELATPAGLEAKARELIADPRARASFERFTDMWFGIDKLATTSRSASAFPQFGDATRAAMRDELHRLFAKHLWAESVPLLDVYTTRTGWLSTELAGIYGVTASGEHDWADHESRGGLFTTAGLLTLTARNDFTSPIQRGLYVRETVLCEKLTLPAGGVPPITIMPGETQEQAESRHTSDPACTGCHLRIDPVGLGLERYDAVGALRTQYPDGKPVKLAGKVLGLDVPDYAGGVELGRIVRTAPAASRCAVQHVFRWAMARMEDKGGIDACTLEQLGDRFESTNQSFTELVVALATHDAFRSRRPNEP
ncbi:MAG: DUF1592 domain-containing protein [Myxococcaceae bacterium]|nr:DUF1592 domain-containing protein [Myxococcaceae bacterium]